MAIFITFKHTILNRETGFVNWRNDAIPRVGEFFKNITVIDDATGTSPSISGIVQDIVWTVEGIDLYYAPLSKINNPKGY